jgi:serine protease Do
MKRIAAFFLFACLTVSAFAQSEKGESSAAIEEHFEKLGVLFRQSAERVAPAVVNICVLQNRAAGRANRSPKTPVSGSGIVVTIAQKQVILTNRHVIGDAERGSVMILTHDRRILTPVKIASNEDFDLAILEVSEKLPRSAPFGNSEHVRTGDLVLAIGNPLELDRSLSMGMISAVGRRRVPNAGNSAPLIDFFQTDAAINPGSSGGALLNLRGEVIGIVTAIATQGGGNEGIAFVMPINAVLRIAEQLVQNGRVTKPYIGCNFDPDFSQLASSFDERQQLGIERFIGAKILTVAPNTPAEQVGLKSGDVILTFGNTEVEDDFHMINLVAQSEIGKPVPLKINRNGDELKMTVTPQAHLSR